MKEKIYIISGTNREQAVSLQVANRYKSEFETLGIEAEIIDLKDLPDNYIAEALYDNAGFHEGMVDIRKKMKDAKKFVFIVAEYNGSFPGVLKAFIDGLEFPGTFTGKKAALVGVSSGIQGGIIAMSHLTDILNYCGANVLARRPKLANIEKNMENGEITNERYMKHIRLQVKELLDF